MIAASSFSGRRISSIFIVIFGYLVVMAPWYLRNVSEIGYIFPKGSSRVLWLTEYNDLFIFDPTQLTFSNWYKQGIEQISRNIFDALGSNLRTMLFVQGEIILVPLIILGIKKFIIITRIAKIKTGILGLANFFTDYFKYIANTFLGLLRSDRPSLSFHYKIKYPTDREHHEYKYTDGHYQFYQSNTRLIFCIKHKSYSIL